MSGASAREWGCDGEDEQGVRTGECRKEEVKVRESTGDNRRRGIAREPPSANLPSKAAQMTSVMARFVDAESVGTFFYRLIFMFTYPDSFAYSLGYALNLSSSF